MEYANAFLGKTTKPSDAEVNEVLGTTAELWSDFIAWMAEKEGVAEQEWKGICVKKYGWSLRLKQKKRNIIYLSPGRDCFLASFVLSDKALNEAKHAHLPKRVQDALETAPRYPEGNGLRLLVHRAADLAPVRQIAAIKLSS